MHLHLNGETRRIGSDPGAMLLDVLRNELGLTGAKFGCGQGECGACMVQVDGRAQPSCELPLWSLEGKRIVTIEGLGTPECPHPVQSALIDARAGQCGYCLPGIVVSASALLASHPLHPAPTREEICQALDRNLCRCGSHARIIDAVSRAALALAKAKDG